MKSRIIRVLLLHQLLHQRIILNQIRRQYHVGQRLLHSLLDHPLVGLQGLLLDLGLFFEDLDDLLRVEGFDGLRNLERYFVHVSDVAPEVQVVLRKYRADVHKITTVCVIVYLQLQLGRDGTTQIANKGFFLRRHSSHQFQAPDIHHVETLLSQRYDKLTLYRSSQQGHNPLAEQIRSTNI